MTYAPQTLTALDTYWRARGGVSLGIVGNAAHNAKGTSYHLGKDKLTATAYSRVLPRDRAGLTDAASAIDLGRLGGTYPGLQAFSSWLAEQCMAGAPGSSDVREVIFSPDGKTVVGWSALQPDSLIPNYGDATHRTHTHISYFRDSELRDKTELFKPYWAPKEAELLIHHEGGGLGTVAVSGAGHFLINARTGKADKAVAAGQVLRVTGEGPLLGPDNQPKPYDAAPGDRTNVWEVRIATAGQPPFYALKADCGPLKPNP